MMQLTRLFALVGVVATIAPSSVLSSEPANSNGYYQEPSGSASFTQYTGCSSPGTSPLPSIAPPPKG